MRVALIAGESSGDQLGAALIKSLRELEPRATFEGVAGPGMAAAGCQVVAPADALAVMGLVEVLSHLPRLLALRRQLVNHFLANPPDVFIGIDAPDFNLSVEARLKAAGIPTVHYVSPSVWAWRPGRVHTVARVVDRVLTLFPFEKAFYDHHGVTAEFVGHPLADRIPLSTDKDMLRESLGIEKGPRYLALLPGSRYGEVKRLGPAFIRTAAWLAGQRPALRFLAPMASPRLHAVFEGMANRLAPGLPLTLFPGRSHEVMGAADAVLLASGTAALEAMLLKRPMVVAYRLAPLSYAIFQALHLVRLKRYSLPNLLAGRELVAEYIQGAAQPQRLGPAVLGLLDDPALRSEQQEAFVALHESLRRDASGQAARSVLTLARR